MMSGWLLDGPTRNLLALPGKELRSEELPGKELTSRTSREAGDSATHFRGRKGEASVVCIALFLLDWSSSLWTHNLAVARGRLRFQTEISVFCQKLYYILVCCVSQNIARKPKPCQVIKQEKFNLKDNLQDARKAVKATRGKASLLWD